MESVSSFRIDAAERLLQAIAHPHKSVAAMAYLAAEDPLARPQVRAAVADIFSSVRPVIEEGYDICKWLYPDLDVELEPEIDVELGETKAGKAASMVVQVADIGRGLYRSTFFVNTVEGCLGSPELEITFSANADRYRKHVHSANQRLREQLADLWAANRFAEPLRTYPVMFKNWGLGRSLA